MTQNGACGRVRGRDLLRNTQDPNLPEGYALPGAPEPPHCGTGGRKTQFLPPEAPGAVSDPRRRQRLCFSRLAPRTRARVRARARAMVPMATQIAPQPFFLSPRGLLYGGISSSPDRSNPKSHNQSAGPARSSAASPSLPGSGLRPSTPSGGPCASAERHLAAVSFHRTCVLKWESWGPLHQEQGFVLLLLCPQGPGWHTVDGP